MSWCNRRDVDAQKGLCQVHRKRDDKDSAPTLESREHVFTGLALAWFFAKMPPKSDDPGKKAFGKAQKIPKCV